MALVESSIEANPSMNCRINSLHGPKTCGVGKISTKSVGGPSGASPQSGFTFLTTSFSSACRPSVDLAFNPTNNFAVTPPMNQWNSWDDSEWAVDQDVGLDIDNINLGSSPLVIPIMKKKVYTYSSSSMTNSFSEASVEASCPWKMGGTNRGRRVSLDSSSTASSSTIVQQVREEEFAATDTFICLKISYHIFASHPHFFTCREQTFVHHSNSPFEPPSYFEERRRSYSSVSATSTASTTSTTSTTSFVSSSMENQLWRSYSSTSDSQSDDTSTKAAPSKAKKKRKLR
uniref:Uncharacterized protein n=1 Tax=Triparma pacifica TaxID=91992 RepID=A0A6T5U6W9_9STRA|mmetsp:Transcript_569/g.936  ORF Transcript_569/g.936 Transcript_569/m.936 type:complete len:288 (+) Transcript_569:202-1065(+)